MKRIAVILNSFYMEMFVSRLYSKEISENFPELRQIVIHEFSSENIFLSQIADESSSQNFYDAVIEDDRRENKLLRQGSRKKIGHIILFTGEDSGSSDLRNGNFSRNLENHTVGDNSPENYVTGDFSAVNLITGDSFNGGRVTGDSIKINHEYSENIVKEQHSNSFYGREKADDHDLINEAPPVFKVSRYMPMDINLTEILIVSGLKSPGNVPAEQSSVNNHVISFVPCADLLSAAEYVINMPENYGLNHSEINSLNHSLNHSVNNSGNPSESHFASESYFEKNSGKLSEKLTQNLSENLPENLSENHSDKNKNPKDVIISFSPLTNAELFNALASEENRKLFHKKSFRNIKKSSLQNSGYFSFSDLVYYIKSRKEKAVFRISKGLTEVNGKALLPGAKNFSELDELTSEDADFMLDFFARDFGRILVIIQRINEASLKIMSLSEKIIVSGFPELPEYSETDRMKEVLEEEILSHTGISAEGRIVSLEKFRDEFRE